MVNRLIRIALFTPRNIKPTKMPPLSGLALKLLAISDALKEVK